MEGKHCVCNKSRGGVHVCVCVGGGSGRVSGLQLKAVTCFPKIVGFLPGPQEKFLFPWNSLRELQGNMKKELTWKGKSRFAAEMKTQHVSPSEIQTAAGMKPGLILTAGETLHVPSPRSLLPFLMLPKCENCFSKVKSHVKGQTHAERKHSEPPPPIGKNTPDYIFFEDIS